MNPLILFQQIGSLVKQWFGRKYWRIIDSGTCSSQVLARKERVEKFFHDISNRSIHGPVRC